jgi:hypothetical protein
VECRCAFLDGQQLDPARHPLDHIPLHRLFQQDAEDGQNVVHRLRGLDLELRFQPLHVLALDLRGETGTAKRLAEREQALEGSRLQREGAFRESLTDAERRWLHENRPAHAAHWNMLSTVNAPELANAL